MSLLRSESEVGIVIIWCDGKKNEARGKLDDLLRKEFDKWDKLEAREAGIGKRIATRMMDLGLTQRELARRSHLTTVSICHYVNDERVPNANILVALAKALETTPNYLVGWDE